jgi:Flp pilus assembly pilin Flp
MKSKDIKISTQDLFNLTQSLSQGTNDMISKTDKSNIRNYLGQGMTEYIIIVAVISVAAIGAFGYFGKVVETQIAGVSQELGGVDGTETRSAAGDLGSESASLAEQDNNNMGQFTDNRSGEAGGGDNN